MILFSTEQVVTQLRSKKMISAFAITPEFNITNFAKSIFTADKKKTRELNSSRGYKALVFVFLAGGMDSYNLLVPHSLCSGENLYDQYASIRQSAALPKSQLLEINVPSWGPRQPCSKFGVINKMPFLKSLYDSQEASFLTNIGTLVEPLNSNDYLDSLPTIFSKKLFEVWYQFLYGKRYSWKITRIFTSHEPCWMESSRQAPLVFLGQLN
jgi:hypothetical protein